VKITQLHPWDVSPTEAIRTQTELAGQIVREGQIDEANVKLVAGADISVEGKRGRAAVVVLNYPDLEVVEHAVAEVPITFPYVPGLLSFREIPALAEAFAGIESSPDLLVADGQGVAHYRRFGFASHLGLLLDIPTIGCAKSRLCGEYEPVGEEVGSRSPLSDSGELIGMVLRTRHKVHPLFISVGHKISLDDAVAWTLRLNRGFRLPEPTRLADKLAGGRLDLPPSTAKENAEQLSLL
jgi:deoxyribonuclease V